MMYSYIFFKSLNKGAYQLAFQISKLNEMNSNTDGDQLSNTYQFVLFVIEGPWAYLGHFVIEILS